MDTSTSELGFRISVAVQRILGLGFWSMLGRISFVNNLPKNTACDLMDFWAHALLHTRNACWESRVFETIDIRTFFTLKVIDVYLRSQP